MHVKKCKVLHKSKVEQIVRRGKMKTEEIGGRKSEPGRATAAEAELRRQAKAIGLGKSKGNSQIARGTLKNAKWKQGQAKNRSFTSLGGKSGGGGRLEGEKEEDSTYTSSGEPV